MSLKSFVAAFFFSGVFAAVLTGSSADVNSLFAAENNPIKKTSEVMENAQLETRIKAKFVANKLTHGTKININVKEDKNDKDKNVAWLTGEVKTQKQKQLAQQYAYDVEGVHEVVNKITVNPKFKD